MNKKKQNNESVKRGGVMKRWLIAGMLAIAFTSTPLLLANKVMDVSPSKHMLSLRNGQSGKGPIVIASDKASSVHKCKDSKCCGHK